MIHKRVVFALLCAFVIGTISLCGVNSEYNRVKQSQETCQDSYTRTTYTFLPTVQSCVTDLFETTKTRLCDVGCQSCKGACFMPEQYKCENGEVVQKEPNPQESEDNGDDVNNDNDDSIDNKDVCKDSYTGATYQYSPNIQSCVTDLVEEEKQRLCDVGCESCKGVCFMPSNYTCENEEVVQKDPNSENDDNGNNDNNDDSSSNDGLCRDSYAGESYVYSSEIQSCVIDLVEQDKQRLCDVGCQSCKGVCFMPEKYKCENEKVVQKEPNPEPSPNPNPNPQPSEDNDDDNNDDNDDNENPVDNKEICKDSYTGVTYQYSPDVQSCVTDLVEEEKQRLCDVGCESCKGICFMPSNYTCENGEVVQKEPNTDNDNEDDNDDTPIEEKTCEDSYDGVKYTYSTDAHSCVADLEEPLNTKLCDVGCFSCKGACFDPSKYKCENGNIEERIDDPTLKGSCQDSYTGVNYVYFVSVHSCVSDIAEPSKTKLCDVECKSCKGICYFPDEYDCQEGKIVQI